MQVAGSNVVARGQRITGDGSDEFVEVRLPANDLIECRMPSLDSIVRPYGATKLRPGLCRNVATNPLAAKIPEHASQWVTSLEVGVFGLHSAESLFNASPRLTNSVTELEFTQVFIATRSPQQTPGRHEL